jgi:hypothetical protein
MHACMLLLLLRACWMNRHVWCMHYLGVYKLYATGIR